MDFEVTKREIIFSIIIASFMIIIGIFIGNKIINNINDGNIKYSTAVKIDNNKSQFKHGLDTNFENALVYGDLYAVDTVSLGTEKNKIVILREYEEYRRHTRTRTYTDSNGHTKTKTEVYYSWDNISSQLVKNNYVSFCGNIFKTSEFPIPSVHYVKTESCGYNKRYVYSVVDSHYVGTLYANLDNNSILDAKFAENITLKESVEYFSTSTYAVLWFWIPYAILIVFAIFGFCYLENNWLEDKKNFGY